MKVKEKYAVTVYTDKELEEFLAENNITLERAEELKNIARGLHYNWHSKNIKIEEAIYILHLERKIISYFQREYIDFDRENKQ
jgi:hypothetical protein